MKTILRILVTALAVLVVPQLVSGITVTGFTTALLVAFVLALLNFFIRPILSILTLPINILTLGLFTLVLNGLLFWFVQYFVSGFHVSGFLPAFLGAIVVSVISWLGGKIFRTE